MVYVTIESNHIPNREEHSLKREKRLSASSSTLTLGDLSRLLRERESAIAEMTSRRDALAAEIARVDEEVAAAVGEVTMKRGRKPGKRGPGRPPKIATKAKRGRPATAAKTMEKAKRSGRPAGPKGQSGLHNAIRAALTGATDPVKAVNIAKMVLASGYETKSKVFHLIIGHRLAEMSDVVKPERGLYALR